MRAACPSLCPWVLGLCLLLSGCAEPVARRPGGLTAGDQGGAWEVVLPGAATAQELAQGVEQSRRDDALSIRDYCTATADAWPEPDRPTLEGARRLFLEERADEFLYFRTERERWRRGWRADR